MQNHVEPPILLSRIMTFVLATALVVLVALGMTIYNMTTVVEEVDESVSDWIYKPRKEANDIFENLLVALENNDNETIKAMFAQDLINSNDNIDEEIQNAVDFFDGNEDLLLELLYGFMKKYKDAVIWIEQDWFYFYEDIIKIKQAPFNSLWCYKNPHS